jgi:hypothetical protein
VKLHRDALGERAAGTPPGRTIGDVDRTRLFRIAQRPIANQQYRQRASGE